MHVGSLSIMLQLPYLQYKLFFTIPSTIIHDHAAFPNAHVTCVLYLSISDGLCSYFQHKIQVNLNYILMIQLLKLHRHMHYELFLIESFSPCMYIYF